MQNTYQEKILDLEATNNSPRVKLEGGNKKSKKKKMHIWVTPLASNYSFCYKFLYVFIGKLNMGAGLLYVVPEHTVQAIRG